MVPSKYFQQLLKCLDNPQLHAIKDVPHWRASILTLLAIKVTYSFLELTKLKTALTKRDALTLKEHVT